MGSSLQSILLDDIRREVAGFSGTFAFKAKNLTTGDSVGINEDRVMPTASTIKLCILAELYRRVERGDVDLAERVEIMAEDWRPGSGILKDLNQGARLTIHDHATLMIALSDNLSTAVLVRLLGQPDIVQTMHAWGLANTHATFVMPSDGTERDYGRSTPEDLVALLELFVVDGSLSEASRAAIQAMLRTQHYNDQIGRYLPYDPYLREWGDDQRVKIGSKSGFTRGTRVDAGIVWLPEQTYAIALMTTGSADRTFLVEQEGARLNGRVSRLVFDYWTRGRL